MDLDSITKEIAKARLKFVQKKQDEALKLIDQISEKCETEEQFELLNKLAEDIIKKRKKKKKGNVNKDDVIRILKKKMPKVDQKDRTEPMQEFPNPEIFDDQITCEPINDPVWTKQGQLFDRDIIQVQINAQGTDFQNRPLAQTELYPDQELREIIQHQSKPLSPKNQELIVKLMVFIIGNRSRLTSLSYNILDLQNKIQQFKQSQQQVAFNNLANLQMSDPSSQTFFNNAEMKNLTSQNLKLSFQCVRNNWPVLDNKLFSKSGGDAWNCKFKSSPIPQGDIEIVLQIENINTSDKSGMVLGLSRDNDRIDKEGLSSIKNELALNAKGFDQMYKVDKKEQQEFVKGDLIRIQILQSQDVVHFQVKGNLVGEGKYSYLGENFCLVILLFQTVNKVKFISAEYVSANNQSLMAHGMRNRENENMFQNQALAEVSIKSTHKYIELKTGSLSKDIVGNLLHSSIKMQKRKDGWNDNAFIDQDVFKDQVYKFHFKINRMNKDKSGIVIGLSNQASTSLDQIKNQSTAISMAGSKQIYNTKIQTNQTVNDDSEIVISLDPKKSKVVFQIDDEVVANQSYKNITFPLRVQVWMQYNNDSVKMIGQEGPLN